MTGVVGDLTTLATVKAWRDPALTGTTDDTQLQREITACSKFILSQLSRKLTAQNYIENRNGNGQSEITVFNRPLISVTSIMMGNCPIKAATDQITCGFTWDTNPDPLWNTGTIYLRGYKFWYGRQNIQILYLAGLLIQNEPQTPTTTTFPATNLANLWAADFKITYAATGTTLVPVATPPAVGQYAPPVGPDGNYTFNSSDLNVAMLFNYSYTPRDIEEAAVTTIITQVNRRGHIGTDSETLAGEVVTYTKQVLIPSAAEMLSRWTNVVPVMP